MNRVSALAFLLLLAGVRAAQAHPHILIDARAEVLFDGQDRAVAVRNIWSFDDAFSAYAVQGYDSKGDGLPTRRDLQPLAKINVQSLAAYHFFTTVSLDGRPLAIGAPRDYWDTFENERLILQFTVPLVAPAIVKDHRLEVEVYDPDYFAAVRFADGDPVRLVGAPPCAVAVRRPAPLDAGIASRLSVIPADQRTLPDDLRAITSQLVNGASVSCR
jgi:ABC-type uncharacterized transport system substrate-binding protein